MTYRDASLTERRAIMREQLRAVSALVKDETFICAECGRKIRIFYAYRCRWCGFYFCPSCASDHFGPDVSLWRLP
jgi:hypothetical protein